MAKHSLQEGFSDGTATIRSYRDELTQNFDAAVRREDLSGAREIVLTMRHRLGQIPEAVRQRLTGLGMGDVLELSVKDRSDVDVFDPAGELADR